VAKADEIKGKGVKDIFCLSCSDVHVMRAWGKSLDPEGKVRWLADPRNELARALAIEFDLVAALGRKTYKRGAVVIEDGKFVHIGMEPAKGVSVSGATDILTHL
jgi:peroxiredoxin